ncbi:MAG: hypothetical protein HYZ75_19055 [Elusimicrobia bacterium]|nr:hypothetical protein [Elusimicrobiota bacterium]
MAADINPGLPGADLVAQGAADLAGRRETAEALLVSIGAPKLRSLGLTLAEPFLDPEKRLYALLSREGSDAAHSRYNALLRRLVGYERAVACAGSRTGSR